MSGTRLSAGRLGTRSRARSRSGPRSGSRSGSRTRVRPAGRTTPEFLTLATTGLLLLALGLVMTFSASFVQSTQDLGDAFGIFQRQLLWAALGVPLSALAAACDYRWWRRLAYPLLAVTIAACALVLVPGVGMEANGARRWFNVAGVSFQPSELAKFSVAVFTAAVLASRWRRVRAGDLRALLLPAAPAVGVVALVVLAGPDLETAVLIAAIGGLVLYTAGLPLRFVAAGGLLTTAAAVVSVATTEFRQARLQAWLDPTAYAGTFGYQTLQGFIALGSGGVLGRGLGQGRGQWLYVPNAHTDFIYAIIGEELGLVGALFVLLLFTALAVGGLRTAKRAPDPFGRLLATALTGWIVLQATMNMGSVVGLLPVTGVTLPLVSFGGSSLVVTLLALGVLLSIARSVPPGRSEAEADRR